VTSGISTGEVLQSAVIFILVVVAMWQNRRINELQQRIDRWEFPR